jgi:tetratricopeptide (TPR) repeat protein
MMTLFTRAVELEKTGEFGKAREFLEQCAAVQCHDRGDVAFHLGWCLENEPDSDRIAVLQHYELAFAEAPALVTRVNSAFRSGWVLMQDRDYERAEVSFRKAVELAERSRLDGELHHHALFWHAVCLENKGQYLDAVQRHRLVKRLSPVLAPESRYREILCHNQVGRYEEALALCRAYPSLAPAGFDPRRYSELYDLAKKEEALLVRCLGGDIAGKGVNL